MREDQIHQKKDETNKEKKAQTEDTLTHRLTHTCTNVPLPSMHIVKAHKRTAVPIPCSQFQSVLH